MFTPPLIRTTLALQARVIIDAIFINTNILSCIRYSAIKYHRATTQIQGGTMCSFFLPMFYTPKSYMEFVGAVTKV